jgi:hypothetical protein
LIHNNNILEYQIAVEKLIESAFALAATIMLYMIPVVGWAIAVIDGCIFAISSIFQHYGILSDSVSLGKLLVMAAEWIAGVTSGEVKQRALNQANSALYEEYKYWAETEYDPNMHWFFELATPPPT